MLAKHEDINLFIAFFHCKTLVDLTFYKRTGGYEINIPAVIKTPECSFVTVFHFSTK
jgi:hypothetical protein